MSVQDTLVAIWERVLGTADLGTDDNFCSLGGDAVAAAEVLSLVRDAFEVELDLDTVLGATTPLELAQLVERLWQEGPRADDADTAPLAFSQEGMLWHEQFAPGSFNLPPFVRRYQGALDVAALLRALSDIVDRHAPLRTTFEVLAGRPVQRIGPAGSLPVSVTDLRGIDPDGQRAEIAQAVADATAEPFDLSGGALFQPRLYQLGDLDHVLLIRLHHLAFDDWAVDVFRRELSELYQNHAKGQPPALPELRASFADFCRRQRRRMAGVAGARELAYWRQELAGAPLCVPLPLGDPARPEGSSYPAAVALTRPLPRRLVQPLRVLARRHRCSVFMALLAIFAVAVHGYTGQEDLLLASVVANRNEADLEPLIGCFTKKIPLRIRVAGASTFLDVLTGARNTVLGALAHQDLAFETVVQEVLGAEASSLGVVPDLSVMFQADAPRKDRLVLTGLTIGGYDTGSMVRQPHFASGDGAVEGEERPVWGGGMYSGTFLILSVVETEDGVSLVARGAFHPPAVAGLLTSFEAVLAAVVADPGGLVSRLAQAVGDRPDRRRERSRPFPRLDLRGFPVEPARIEAALAGCPGVSEVAVLVREATLGRPTIVAYVVPDGEAPAPTLAAVRSYLWSRLPGYAWPAAVVPVAALPGGGVDEVPPPDRSGPAPSGTPRLVGDALTADEQLLSGLWAEVIGSGPVRLDTNYWQKFSFVDVIHQAQKGGVDLSTEQVRRNRTLETLAADMTATALVEGAPVRVEKSARGKLQP